MSRSARHRGSTVLRWTGWLLLLQTVIGLAVVVSAALWFRASPAPLWIGLWLATLVGALVGRSASCGIALLPYPVESWRKIRQGGWEGWVRLSDLVMNGR